MHQEVPDASNPAPGGFRKEEPTPCGPFGWEDPRCTLHPNPSKEGWMDRIGSDGEKGRHPIPPNERRKRGRTSNVGYSMRRTRSRRCSKRDSKVERRDSHSSTRSSSLRAYDKRGSTASCTSVINPSISRSKSAFIAAWS